MMCGGGGAKPCIGASCRNESVPTLHRDFRPPDAATGRAIASRTMVFRGGLHTGALATSRRRGGAAFCETHDARKVVRQKAVKRNLAERLHRDMHRPPTVSVRIRAACERHLARPTRIG